MDQIKLIIYITSYRKNIFKVEQFQHQITPSVSCKVLTTRMLLVEITWKIEFFFYSIYHFSWNFYPILALQKYVFYSSMKQQVFRFKVTEIYFSRIDEVNIKIFCKFQ